MTCSNLLARLDDKRVAIELPPAKILAMDPIDVEVLQLENGLWNRISPGDLETELRALPDLARRKAEQSGLKKEAVNTFVNRLREKLGDQYDIVVEIADRAPAPAP